MLFCAKNSLPLLLVFCCMSSAVEAETLSLSSPDKAIQLEVDVSAALSFSVAKDGQVTKGRLSLVASGFIIRHAYWRNLYLWQK